MSDELFEGFSIMTSEIIINLNQISHQKHFTLLLLFDLLLSLDWALLFTLESSGSNLLLTLDSSCLLFKFDSSCCLILEFLELLLIFDPSNHSICLSSYQSPSLVL